MALLSELVATCEQHRVDTGATLNVFARRLREAGRLSQAGRGRGAAHMTFLDAARFLVACAATDHPGVAADAEFEFSRFVNTDYQMDAALDLSSKVAPTLDVAVAKVLEMLSDGTVDRINKERQLERNPELDERHLHPPVVELIVHRSGTALMRVLDFRADFHHPALAAVSAAIRSGAGREATQIATEAFSRETHRFRSGKNLSAELTLPLLQAVASLIGGNLND